MKKITAITVFLFAVFVSTLTVFAGSYSSAWYQSGGNWYIKGPNGQMLKSCWVCDNAAGPGSQNNWYLIDANGTMVKSPLVVDATGHYYSLETANNGNYGMIRHVNGTYDGISLTFEQTHNGFFGSVTNMDGINALAARYGVYNISHISPDNCYYTSNYISSISGSGYVGSLSNYTHTINYFVNGSKWMVKQTNDSSLKIASYGSSLLYWNENATGEIYYPGEYYYFGSGYQTASLYAVLQNTQNYTTIFRVNGSTYRSLSSGGSCTVPYAMDLDGQEFLYWNDAYGNHWNPGEIYTNHSTTDYLDAVYRALTEDTYWQDSDGNDVYDYARENG